MGFQGAAEQKIEQWAGRSINLALIAIAIGIVGIVLFINNKWIKAAILAWIVLP